MGPHFIQPEEIDELKRIEKYCRNKFDTHVFDRQLRRTDALEVAERQTYVIS